MKRPTDTVRARLNLYEKLRLGSISLSEATREMRRIVGKTQPEYAKLIGITIRILREIEAGTANPTLETLNKIARPFGLKVGFIPKPPISIPH